MEDQFARMEMLLGREGMDRLRGARVAVFGIGGVGGYVCEALARSGVGALDLIDHDRISLTNLNRQIIATWKTLGQYKVEAMRERIEEINPRAQVRTYRTFFLPENAEEFSFAEYDYVVDAVDTVTAKLGIILTAKEAGVPVISSMGAGNKLDGSLFQVADIYETKVCPLAKVMRRELKRRGVERLKVVYSEETPILPKPGETPICLKPEETSVYPKSGKTPICKKTAASPLEEPMATPFEGGSSVENPIGIDRNPGKEEIPEEAAAGLSGETAPRNTGTECTYSKSIPGSAAFVPSVAGLILAGEVIRDLCGIS